MNFALLALVCVGFSQQLFSSEIVTGKVAVRHDSTPFPVKVVLFSDASSVLKNKRLSFSNAPIDFKPDSSGCFCFDIDDERFAFVHAYYHANRQITEVNRILNHLLLPPIEGVTLSLNQNSSGVATYGSTSFDGRSISIGYAHPAMDISILAHEVGHVIHMQLMDGPIPELLGMPGKLEDISVEEYRTINFQAGVYEGAAQLSAVFYTLDSRIGRYAALDAAMEMDNFVRFPDLVPTIKWYHTRRVNAPLFSTAYPNTVEISKVILGDSLDPPPFPPHLFHLIKASMDWPEPYTASAAIVQPLLWAAREFGRVNVMEIYLKSLSSLKHWRGYRDWAQMILDKATTPEIKEFLKYEFDQRGLLEVFANP